MINKYNIIFRYIFQQLKILQEKSEIRTSSSDMENIQAICGLEISFSSVPQDIDIKLIPTGDHRMMTTE